MTGGIATGKSTVAAILNELGAAIINADQIARDLVEAGTQVLGEIVREFGPDYLRCDGTLDRKKLGKRVFGDAAALAKLNRIVHPHLRREVSERLGALRRESPERPIVLEAAVLFEMGADALVDKIIVTECPRPLQVARLMERGLSRQEAEARVDSQMPAAHFLRRADLVVGIDSNLTDTREQVGALWREHIVQRQQEGAVQI